MKRIALAAAVALTATAALMAAPAGAHLAAVTVACQQTSFTYRSFPSGSNAINEKVSVDGTTAVSKTFTFSGSSATDAISLALPSGTHTVSAHADWSVEGGGILDQSFTVTCGAGHSTHQHDHQRCNSGRGNGSEGSSSQLITPGTGSRGTSPTLDCDPGNSGSHNHGGD